MDAYGRIAIFTGHFGSGKTELAINYSLFSAKKGFKTVIVDLDIVNPFFRTSEKKDILEEHGIRVISPTFVGTGLDIPSLPAEIYSVFQDKSLRVIFDVGGDDVGATALGRFYPYFQKEQYHMYYVINIRRPLSNTRDDIIEMLRSIESKSRLNVTHLINNGNLSKETTIRDLREGKIVVDRVSQDLGIPVAYTSGKKEILESLRNEISGKPFPLEIFMIPFYE